MTESDPPVPVAWQTGAIERIERRTARVKSFFLRPESWRAFQAGQHLDIRLTAPGGYQAQRSYSVASSPARKGLYELVIERLEEGEVSPFLHDSAEVGDTMEIRGPFGGHFVWRPDDGAGAVLLVGGGSGVAPLMSILRHRVEAGSPAPMLLIYADRRWDDVLFRDELLALDADAAGFTLLLSLSRDAAHRPQDASGRIDAPRLATALARVGAAPQRTYVCGSTPFVEAVSGHLLELGLAAGTIRTERFGG